jgi:YidC/Oxa1 family membrane protein insertase
VDRNLLLAFVLSFLVLYSWSAWQQAVYEETAPPPEVAQETGETPGGIERESEPTTRAPSPDRFPSLPEAEAPLELPTRGVPSPEALVGEAGAAERIELDLPLAAVTLSSRGAALESWELKTYTDPEGARVVVVDPEDRVGDVALTPFLPLGLGDLSTVLWKVVERDADRVAFELELSGVRIVKTYSFDRDSYTFRLRLDLENGSDAPVSTGFLIDWPAELRAELDFSEQSLAALVDGTVEQVPIAGVGSAGFFGSLTGSRAPDKYDYPGEIDWAGVQSTYFLAAVLPDKPTQANARIVVLEPSSAGTMQVYFDPVQIPSGQSLTREYRAYIGPKETERLEQVGSGTIASIDLGWSWVAPLTRGFAWLLHAIYSVVPNYGLAIILLTILVRVATAPLTVKQMRSMERMRRVQPRMKEIQEKYADDRQRQSEEMMRLYRQEKVNPLGGCFPMLLQLPVFIGLFYALRSSILLRQAPFFGWIDDLSAPDELFVLPGIGIPVRVLPLIMGVTMFAQQKITPMQTPDPAQARMMLTIMPVMMTVLFYQFPSGLVLYWMMSNLLAIAHQLWIGRKMQPS